MATQFREGQRLQGSDGNIYVVRGGVPMLDTPAAPQSVTLGSPSPKAAYEAPLAAAQLDKIRSDIANQNKPSLPQGYRWKGGVVGGEAEPIPGLPPNVGAVKLSAKERADAIAGFKSAQQLDDIIKDLEAKYAAGPGKTKGLKGLRDYLPYTANQDFDNAGNAARGIVGQALGFTGGQLNTATEAAMSVGPYLPQSGDRDQVILSKIARLKDLAQKARERAIAQLGGVPDANGNITPVEQLGLATGDQKFTPDEAGSRLATELARNGMSDEQINSALQAGGFAPLQPASINSVREFLKQNPGFKGTVPGVGKFDQTSFLNRAAASPVGTFVGNAMVTGSAGLPVALGGQDAKQAFDLANETNPKSALAGGAVGGLTASLGAGKLLAPFKLASAAPRTTALLGDTLYGATYGFNTADEGNGAEGALLGAAGGAIGNRVGAGVTRAAGATMRGVVNPSVDYLRSRGIPLTGGQMLGGMVKSIEDKATSVPILGDLIRNRRAEGLNALNDVAFQEAGDAIGYPAKRTGAAGIDDLKRAAGSAYDSATAGVTAPLDPQFNTDLSAAKAMGAGLPGDLSGRFNLAVKNRVDPVTDGGIMTGEGYQQAIRGLKGYKAETSKPGFEQDYRDALSATQDALTGAMTRGGGQDVVTGLQSADKTYRMTKVLEDAVKRARNGPRSGEVEVFTPSQLNDAAVANRFSGNGTNRPFYDLGKAGQEVLPSQYPDSGTPGRLLAYGVGAGLLGGGAEYGLTGDVDNTAKGAAALTALSLLNTKTGTKTLAKLLLDRPDIMRRLGTRVVNGAPRLGMFGRGAGVTAAGMIAN